MPKKACFVFFLALFCLSARAYSFNTYKINAEISQGRVVETLTVDMLNDDLGPISSGVMSLPPDARVLEIRDTSGTLSYSAVVGEQLTVRYNLSVPLGPGESRIVTVMFETKTPLGEKEDYTEYTSTMLLQKQIKGFEFILKLPVGASLYPVSPVVPAAETEEVGGRVWVTWKKEVLEPGIPHAFIVKYVEPETDYSLYFALAAAMVAAVLLYLFRKPVLEMIEEKRRLGLLDKLSFVNENERDILRIIIQNKEVPQYELKKQLSLPKSSVSRFLSNLEKRGIIIKEKRGKVNRWRLNPDKT